MDDPATDWLTALLHDDWLNEWILDGCCRSPANLTVGYKDRVAAVRPSRYNVASPWWTSEQARAERKKKRSQLNSQLVGHQLHWTGWIISLAANETSPTSGRQDLKRNKDSGRVDMKSQLLCGQNSAHTDTLTLHSILIPLLLFLPCHQGSLSALISILHILYCQKRCTAPLFLSDTPSLSSPQLAASSVRDQRLNGQRHSFIHPHAAVASDDQQPANPHHPSPLFITTLPINSN